MHHREANSLPRTEKQDDVRASPSHLTRGFGGRRWQTTLVQLIRARRAAGLLSLTARDAPWQSRRKNTNKSTPSRDGWNTMPRKSGKTHVWLSRRRWRKRASGHETWPRLESPINVRPPSFGTEKPAGRWQMHWCGRTRGSVIMFESSPNQKGKTDSVAKPACRLQPISAV